MATSHSSHHPKSPRSPRQLPALPGHRSPNQLTCTKSPSTTRVFEFPPEFCGTNFDGLGSSKSPQRSPSSCSSSSSQTVPRSASLHGGSCPAGLKSPCSSGSSGSAIFQFCKPRRNIIKTLSYPPKSPLDSPSTNTRGKQPRPSSPRGPAQAPGPSSRQRNMSLNLGPDSPASPSIVTPSSARGLANAAGDSPSEELFRDSAFSPDGSASVAGQIQSAELAGWRRQSLKTYKKKRSRSKAVHGCLNKSQSYLNEVAKREAKTGCSAEGGRSMSRKSTSDLTELNDADTEVTVLSSPRRRGSMKGGLAYLASRRGSRDSQISNVSNVSNEEIGPLNFSSHPRGRQRRTSNFLELPVPDHIRPRVLSLPEKAYNPRSGDDLYRLRAFSITNKGVVNRGDSILSRRSRSNTSVNSSRNSNVSGDRSPFDGSCCSGQGVASLSTESEPEEITKYRVVLLGDSGVGKTALVSQFMTSEYINTYDASLDDEFGEKTVSILLEDEESDVIFIDHPHIEMSLENSLSTYEPHACIIVYSIVSRASFQMAEEMLNYLWREHYTQERSVILVGNKSDLARSRAITTNEGKQLATSRECKFIESSSGIKHNVDELLVGVLKQIRLRESRDRKLRRRGSKFKVLSKLHDSKTALSLNLARDILSKICLNDNKSKSCENLHVL
ncbi:uncharacterized protein LOC106642751 [Copidosoma floridanum]|uniref:uncharacterized protein LOC106642751 n=1 Tax=Copidosoma floridanum TaxID=29053 RepID=UPI0006C96C98|nr:uncharacterized protein LOC106642751 [Copidosoma floridanum]